MKTSYDTVEITQWSVLMNEEILQQIAAIEEQVAKLKELVLGASPIYPNNSPSKLLSPPLTLLQSSCLCGCLKL